MRALPLTALVLACCVVAVASCQSAASDSPIAEATAEAADQDQPLLAEEMVELRGELEITLSTGEVVESVGRCVLGDRGEGPAVSFSADDQDAALAYSTANPDLAVGLLGRGEDGYSLYPFTAEFDGRRVSGEGRAVARLDDTELPMFWVINCN